MTFPYVYTPYIWPVLVSATFLAVLGIYGWRHRTAPGAIPFIILAGAAILWVLAHALELSGTDDTTRIFWFKFRAALLLSLVPIALCFALEYAGLGKWLTRRTLALLAIVPLLFVLLVLTNDRHQLIWSRIWISGHIRADLGPAHWVAVVYGYFLSLLHLAVLAWLFVRSPRHRWIAGGLILAAFSIRGASLLNFTNWNPVKPIDPIVVVMNFALLPYALAIVRFHLFDVVPVARDTVIERMADGMMVLDAENRIADLNGKAQTLFGVVRSNVIGSKVTDVLHAYPDLLRLVREPGETQCEVSFGGPPACWYQVSISPLIDERNFQLGRLMFLHNITGQKRAQAHILDQQLTLAMLEEREMLARELHDGIGQTLAAAYLQVKAATNLLARGDTALAESCLHQLAEATQEANEAVREYLHGVKAGSSPEHGLFTGLRQYVNHYSHNYGIHTELVVPSELEEKRIDSTVEAQLQPIIQEALTNVRRHSGASSVRIIFVPCDNQIRVTVEDGGRGFDPEKISEYQRFGLRSMRGRAEAVGGLLKVNSSPGRGTQVIVQVPWRKEGL